MALLPYLIPFPIFVTFAWLVLRAEAKVKRKERMAAGAQPMENVVRLMAYNLDESGYWRRLRWLSGLLYGAAGAAVILVLPIPGARYFALTAAAFWFAVGGPLFGLLFPAAMRRKVRLAAAGLYAGERWIIDPPSAELSVRYQIPCTRITGRVGVGGVLYLGRGGLLFVPHKRNRIPSPPIEMTPIEGVTVARVAPLAGNALFQLLVPRPLEQIEIVWDGASARFVMPNPAGTVAKLGRCLEALRRAPE